jgi:hypothetical protein
VGLKTKDVTVIVHLDLSSAPPFTLETSLPKTSKGYLKFKNGKKDGFMISFELDDPDNVYTWGPDPAQALWSTSQAVCPTTPGQWDQFTAQAINDGGMTLEVLNKNETVQDFGYTLRVTKDNGANYVDLDPIGSNQNGNLSKSFGVALSATIGGAAVGYLATQFAMPAATSMATLTGAIVGAVLGFGLYSVIQNSRGQPA